MSTGRYRYCPRYGRVSQEEKCRGKGVEKGVWRVRKMSMMTEVVVEDLMLDSVFIYVPGNAEEIRNGSRDK